MELDEEDLTLVRGTTLDFEMTWESEDDHGKLRPVNIEGCTVTMQVRSFSRGDLLLQIDTQDGITTEAASGKMVFHIAPGKTAEQRPDDWSDARWEVRVTFPSGDIYSLGRGWAHLLPGVVV